MTRGYVEVADVWKKFRYGEIHNRLRDLIPALAARALGRRPAGADLWSGEFWALREVSFTVAPGEVMGIIGPNGAGKSTMLKLLTRILRPTRGRCLTRGRVGALIEVAAGFHPDLTGRENVFLQGAIMGMPQREIARKFDEIVEFSGVAAFIDTPVKRYSSGMHARLGFSIAAHLDPDVLIIDEVLSVGDAAFQAKAYGRVTELVRGGIPAVVVSHQLDVVATLCTRALYLERGNVVRAGTPQECIGAYVHGTLAEVHGPGDAGVRIGAITPLGEGVVQSGERLRVHLACASRDDAWPGDQAVSLRVRSSQTGEVLFETSTLRLGVPLPESGAFTVEAELQMNVPAGVYTLESFVWDRLRDRQSFAGPRIHVQVQGGEDFAGPVQMNPRLQLVEGAAASAARDAAR
ncbi:MAG TPA: polysaccharide ABC transporter ATP-binding protein [Gemmatimonadaceae bacterium]|nr:polysaccharide ABC transporter ATP-binding protein [Gemmatimonadaceae bacterium]